MTPSIDQIGHGIRRCRRCERSQTRLHAVPGAGNPSARVLLLGEAPGKTEDKMGAPFVGRTGRYLDSVLKKYGISRESLYITSVLKCFHPDPPTDEQIEACQPWTASQIDALSPAAILVMGRWAARSLFKIDRLGTAKLDRTWRCIPCVVTSHPTAAMRFPERAKQFRRDIRRVMAITGATGRPRDRRSATGAAGRNAGEPNAPERKGLEQKAPERTAPERTAPERTGRA